MRLLKAANNLSIDGEKNFLEEMIFQPEVYKSLIELRKSGIAAQMKDKADENEKQR